LLLLWVGGSKVWRSESKERLGTREKKSKARAESTSRGKSEKMQCKPRPKEVSVGERSARQLVRNT